MRYPNYFGGIACRSYILLPQGIARIDIPVFSLKQDLILDRVSKRPIFRTCTIYA